MSKTMIELFVNVDRLPVGMSHVIGFGYPILERGRGPSCPPLPSLYLSQSYIS